MPETAEAPSITSLEYVRALIKDRSNEIFAQAILDRFTKVSRETHVAVPVHYMGTHIWEAGLVPKLVECDGVRITTGRMLLYRSDSKTVRGADDCILENGVWERFPD